MEIDETGISKYVGHDCYNHVFCKLCSSTTSKYMLSKTLFCIKSHLRKDHGIDIEDSDCVSFLGLNKDSM